MTAGTIRSSRKKTENKEGENPGGKRARRSFARSVCTRRLDSALRRPGVGKKRRSTREGSRSLIYGDRRIGEGGAEQKRSRKMRSDTGTDKRTTSKAYFLAAGGEKRGVERR